MTQSLLVCLLFVKAGLCVGADRPEAGGAGGGTYLPPLEASGEGAMVVTANRHGSYAARAVLRAGGNALDAALAAAFSLGVSEPQSSGLGGSGFLLYYRAADDGLFAFAGRETAPAALPPKIFLDAEGEPQGFREASTGGLAVGVPGWLKMAELAHTEFGRLDWQSLLQPAIALARLGFLVSPRLHKLLGGNRRLATLAPQLGFFDADGEPLPIAAHFTNPALAKTLETIAAEGSHPLHYGGIAEQVVTAVAAGGGVMTLADLSSYEASRLPPLCGDYRSRYEVCSLGLPTSGGITILRILRSLESRELNDEGKATSALLEAFVRAYDERRDLGDSMEKPPSTTHISVVDGEGNIATMTASIGPAFGSLLAAAGFLLNGEMTDFAFGGEGPNRIRGGARPLSSQAPLIVFAEGSPRLVMGSAGGLNIIAYLARVLVEIVDLGKTPAAAVAAGNFSAFGGKITMEAGAERELTEEFPQLSLQRKPMTSGISLISIRGDEKIGVADPRREGLPLGDNG